MRNIEILVSLAGADFCHSVGDVITPGEDVEPAEAGRWIAAGYAEETDAPKGLRSPPVDVVEPPVETAADPKAGVERAAGKGKARAKAAGK